MDQPDLQRPFVFTGSGAGYFRVWIVNLLLTGVTVGFYSPWAKVRRLRYFYGNTLFDGSPFEFHGRPFALFKGRVVGLVLLVVYSQAARVSLTFWLVVVAVLFVLLPWLLWKSLRFRLANSSYRGIRFAFDGTLGQAYLTFVPLMAMVLGPAMVLVVAQAAATNAGAALELRTLARYYAAVAVVLVLAPWFVYRLRAYQHRHARLGTSVFAFDGRVGRAYDIAFKTLIFGIVFVLIGTIGGLVAGGLAWLAAQRSDARHAVAYAAWAGGAVFYLLLISGWSFNRAMMQNFAWRYTTLAGTRFVSGVSRTRLWRIELVNLVATLLTLGFFWPFAVVRSMRYRIGAVSWSGDSDALVAAPAEGRIGATGEETAELFGLDLAL
jgi:uncharacterized membrane protein YjgN (DUF898 family)